MEINLLRLASFGQRMMNVRTVIERRQITNQSQASDRPPTHIFDEAIVHLGVGRNHHGSAGKLAIAESQKQTGAAVDLSFAIDLQRERPAAEASQRNENGRLITKLSPPAETPSP